MKLQRVTWLVQRCGWVALFGLIILALLGLFSNGPLSSARATDTMGRLTAEYERFERNGASTNLLVRVAAASGGQATIVISSSFLAAYKVEAMAPEPTEQRSGPDGIEMIFMASDQEPTQIYLAIRPEQVGLIDSTIGLLGETPVRLKQFVFP